MSGQPKNEKVIRCPLEYGMDVFGGKWKPRILCILGNNGNMRFSDLGRELYDITDAVLSVTLKELIASGLVDRRVIDEMPLKVEYFLTDKGIGVIPILQNICSWSRQFVKPDPGKLLTQCQRCDFTQ